MKFPEIKISKEAGIGLAITALGVVTTLLSSEKTKMEKAALKAEIRDEAVKEVLEQLADKK